MTEISTNVRNVARSKTWRLRVYSEPIELFDKIMTEDKSHRIMYNKYLRLAWLLLIFPIYKLIEGLIENNITNIIIYACSTGGLIIILIVTSTIYSSAMKKRSQLYS